MDTLDPLAHRWTTTTLGLDRLAFLGPQRLPTARQPSHHAACTSSTTSTIAYGDTGVHNTLRRISSFGGVIVGRSGRRRLATLHLACWELVWLRVRCGGTLAYAQLNARLVTTP